MPENNDEKRKLPPPHKPNFFKGYIVGVIIGLLIIALSFATKNAVQAVCVIFLGAVIIGGTLYIYRMLLNQYKLYYSNYEAFIEEQNKMQEQLQKQTEAKNNELAKIPPCPVCGSKNVSKISTLNRSASVAAFGLASSKIGKQYECKSCKHKW